MALKEEGGTNKIQINYVKDSSGKSSLMINIRVDEVDEAIELYKDVITKVRLAQKDLNSGDISATNGKE